VTVSKHVSLPPVTQIVKPIFTDCLYPGGGQGRPGVNVIKPFGATYAAIDCLKFGLRLRC
jgi:hypothetical protein